MTQNMKAKKTSLVRRDLQPSFNQSFDLKLEGLISNTFLTLQLKQARVFTVKGKPGEHKIWMPDIFPISDLTLGSIVLGCAMFARGSGLRQWDKAVHCRNKDSIEETHTLNTTRTQLAITM